MRKLAFSVAMGVVATIGPMVSQTAAADEALAVASRLRTYCVACHGIGDLRFIPDQDDNNTWSFIFSNRSPRSGRLWAEVIADTLAWPSDEPPASTELMVPPSRDWMPKGSRRQQLATDQVDGESARRFMLRVLRK